ncbi:MAG: GEVED domain-containing protein, partial [Chitinophagaceae bacterium]
MKKVLLFGLFLLPIYHCEAQTSNAAPYCKPIFQNTAPNNYISSLDFFGTVNNTGSTNPGYTFFNNIAPAQLTAYNGIAPLILGVASLYANGGVSTPANYIQVYVDYNHNNVFDYYEGIGQSFGNAGAYASIYCRNPTDTALYGITRLRVVWSNDFQSDPCNSVSSFVYNGEVEDYLVRVVGTFPIAQPNAATNLTKSTATLNGTVNVNGVNAVATAFEYGQTTAYTNEVPANSLLADTTGTGHPVTANISGLMATTIYHFRVKAFNGTDTVFSK